jgi:hypothetical protein
MVSRNFRLKLNRRFTLLLLAILSVGCTSYLQNSAQGTPVSLDASAVKLRVVSARIDQVTDEKFGSSFKTINICIQDITNDNPGPPRALIILYPIYDIPPVYFHDENGVLVYRAPYDTFMPGCGTEKIYPRGTGLVVLKELPVIRLDGATPVALNADTDEAVYVAYENGTINSLGYLSARSFFTARYSFGIDLSNSAFYTGHENRKPLLLLLTPLSAAADVAAGAVIFGVTAASCSARPTGCK